MSTWIGRLTENLLERWRWLRGPFSTDCVWLVWRNGDEDDQTSRFSLLIRTIIWLPRLTKQMIRTGDKQWDVARARKKRSQFKLAPRSQQSTIRKRSAISAIANYSSSTKIANLIAIWRHIFLRYFLVRICITVGLREDKWFSPPRSGPWKMIRIQLEVG